jgi:hypothetical protein
MARDVVDNWGIDMSGETDNVAKLAAMRDDMQELWTARKPMPRKDAPNTARGNRSHRCLAPFSLRNNLK